MIQQAHQSRGLRSSPEVEDQHIGRFRVPDSVMRVTPEAAGPDHVAFFDSLAEAGMWSPNLAETMARWAAGVPEPDEIEIFLSAGPADTINSCDSVNQANCKAYRVRWRLSLEALVGTPEEVSPTYSSTPNASWACGFVEPEVDPTSGALAMVRRCFGTTSGHEKSGETHVGFPRAGGRFLFTSFDYAEAAEARPQWPAWYSSNKLMFERAEDVGLPDTMQTLYTVHNTGTSERARAGVLVDPAAKISYGNPRAFRGIGAQQGRVASFGIEGAANANPVPHTHELDGRNQQDFDLALSDPADPGFTSCHHPDWNADGTRIMCTRQSEMEVTADKISLRQLYEFIPAGNPTVWGSAVPVLDTVEFSHIPSTIGSSDDCEILTYKYARYVGSRHVLATVFCSSKSGKTIFGSRVFLIELDNFPAPRYHDITQEVQNQFGAGDEDWRSIFASWRSVA